MARNVFHQGIDNISEIKIAVHQARDELNSKLDSKFTTAQKVLDDLDSEVDALSKEANKIGSGIVKIKADLIGTFNSEFTRKSQSIITEIHENKTKLEKLSDDTTTAFKSLETTLEKAKNDIIVATLSPVPSDVTDKAFDCIRILSQVQDLVTDKSFDKDKNSTTLRDLKQSKPYKDTVKLLSQSLSLENNFQHSFRDFNTNDFNERAERFIEIQSLYKELIRHFTP